MAEQHFDLKNSYRCPTTSTATVKLNPHLNFFLYISALEGNYGIIGEIRVIAY